jgi:hypothetical protein
MDCVGWNFCLVRQHGSASRLQAVQIHLSTTHYKNLFSTLLAPYIFGTGVI